MEGWWVLCRQTAASASNPEEQPTNASFVPALPQTSQGQTKTQFHKGAPSFEVAKTPLNLIQATSLRELWESASKSAWHSATS